MPSGYKFGARDWWKHSEGGIILLVCIGGLFLFTFDSTPYGPNLADPYLIGLIAGVWAGMWARRTIEETQRKQNHDT